MLVHLVTDNHIHGKKSLAEHVEELVKASLDRFSPQITRVEVHLHDDNGAKHGANDKRCTLEARLAGVDPMSVHHTAETIDESLHGALDKIEKMIDKHLDKLSHHKGKPSFGGDQTI